MARKIGRAILRLTGIPVRLLFLLAAIALVAPSLALAQVPNGNLGSSWELIDEFSDEFDSPTLDAGKWHMFKFMNDEYENGSGIDFISFDRYTWLNSFSTMADPYRNVFLSVENGENCLELKIRSDNLDQFADFISPDWHTHTAGVLQANRQLKFGFIEIRAKTAPTAVSSAFWLDTVRPNHHREIDIFELYGTSKAQDGSGGCTVPAENLFLANFLLWETCGGGVYFDTLTAGDHADYFNLANEFPADFPNGFDHTNEFHTYGLLWEDHGIRLYVDGVLIRVIDQELVASLSNGHADQWGNPAEFDWTYPMAMLFTMEGFLFLRDAPCAGANGAAAITDESFFIDYVRVWRRSAESELVANPSFDSNTAGWNIATSGGASASLTHVGSLTFDSSADATSYSETATGLLSLNVTNAGNARGDVVLRSSSFPLEQNSQYRCSFAVRSDDESSTRDERFIAFSVVETGNPGNVIFQSDEYTDRDWAEVNHEFTVGTFSGSGFEILFQCGGRSTVYTCEQDSASPTPGQGVFDNNIEYFFDFVTLGKVGPAETPIVVPPTVSCNIVADSRFLLNNGSWGLNIYPGNSNATFSQGVRTGAISVLTPGSDYWEVTMTQVSINLAANKTYVLDFEGKASALWKSVNVKLIQGTSPYDTVFEQEVGLSQTMTPTRLVFDSGSYVGEMILDFQVGGQGISRFEFDNVTLQPQSCGGGIGVVGVADTTAPVIFARKRFRSCSVANLTARVLDDGGVARVTFKAAGKRAVNGAFNPFKGQWEGTVRKITRKRTRLAINAFDNAGNKAVEKAVIVKR